ncbi:unnamed protein product [Oncorhynchus mykiss]|uniref:Synapsin ATP-binding domain-containing protein n=1 Tax=Oncorhynchus mykiss TaxID=8022 RepID=A0A060XNF4_ONCMY|nr:unnamed protein product [Oncorhynchus mykiss]
MHIVKVKQHRCMHKQPNVRAIQPARSLLYSLKMSVYRNIFGARRPTTNTGEARSENNIHLLLFLDPLMIVKLFIYHVILLRWRIIEQTDWLVTTPPSIPSKHSTPKASAKDSSQRPTPTTQQPQSASQGKPRPGGLGAQQTPPAQPAKPAPPRQRNSAPQLQPEFKAPPQASALPQPEPLAQPQNEPTTQAQQKDLSPEQSQPPVVEQPTAEEKAQAHPSLNKSQSLTNAFGLKETSFFRTASEDVAKAETMRNLRKSFVSLFSD